MATNNSGGEDKSRGTGDDKVTEAVNPNLEADNQRNEPPESNKPDAAGGGYARLGWGCLPVIVGLLMLPTAFPLFG